MNSNCTIRARILLPSYRCLIKEGETFYASYLHL